MKKSTLVNKLLVGSLLLSLAACSGNKAVKKPIEEKEPIKADQTKSGGYYKDDGPGDQIPENLDSIPDAVPQYEEYSSRANQPYIALEKRYTPMKSYQPYKVQGMASWYGKRYHGGKTSTGEIYDMYAMTAAHKTLPIPSYARVTNLENGKSVVVRINDRGPFINGRVIDLSYVAAHKLRMIEAGQTKVEIETIDTRNNALSSDATPVSPETINADILPVDDMPAPTVQNAPPLEDIPVIATYEEPVTSEGVITSEPAVSSTTISESAVGVGGYFVQVGAFQSEQNSYKLMDRLAGFGQGSEISVFQELSENNVYRVKVGPYDSRPAAEAAVRQLKREYNIKGIVR